MTSPTASTSDTSSPDAPIQLAPDPMQAAGSERSRRATSVPVIGALRRMVRGDLGIARTFWLYQVLCQAIGVLCMGIAVGLESESLTLLVIACFGLLNLLSLLGLWQAAARRGDDGAAPTAARCWVIMNLVWMVTSMVA